MRSLISWDEIQKVNEVYKENEQGGLDAYDLSWEDDCAYCNGELCDNAETLRDLFEIEDLRGGFYLSPADWLNHETYTVEFNN